jgi:hypothetical protein
MIKSIRHIVNFYLALTGAVCFFLVMACLLFGLHNTAFPKTGEVVMTLAALVCISGAVYIMIRYVKNAPSIEINNQSITINNKKYPWSDLEKAEMTGKKRFKSLSGNSKEATTLLFKNTKEVYFFDDMYSNSAGLKRFIDQVVVKKQAFERVPSMEVIGNRPVNESLFILKGINFFVPME